MSLWREDQNEDIQLVMEKGEQVLNVSVKMVFFSLSLPEHILNRPPFFPFFSFWFFFFFPGQMTEMGYNLQNPEFFLQFLLFFTYRFIVNSKEDAYWL